MREPRDNAQRWATRRAKYGPAGHARTAYGMSQTFLLVRLEPGLHHSRVAGLFLNMKHLPGVVSVTDLSAISQVTLDAVLCKPEIPETTKKRRKAAA